MICRLPTNESLRPFLKPILSLMLKLLEIDNEENVLVCLRIIIELHKQYRPPFSQEVCIFMNLYQARHEWSKFNCYVMLFRSRIFYNLLKAFIDSCQHK